MENSMENEIITFMRLVFSNCAIQAKYYPENSAWHFQIIFSITNQSFHIRPPKGFCIISVHSMGGRAVMFNGVMFVSDFQKYHLQPIYN